MFTDYFIQQNGVLKESLQANLEAAGRTKKGKSLKSFNEFYRFLKDHIPSDFSLATGKVRSKKHLLNKNIDVLIHNRVIPKMLELAGGYVPVDHLYAFMTLDQTITEKTLEHKSSLTNAVKTLYRMEHDTGDYEIIPVFSIHMGYDSEVSLDDYRSILGDLGREGNIPINAEVDLVSVLDQGILLKNWEQGGRYTVLETKEDTLMWTFILLLEYLDRDGKVGFDPRQYIRNPKHYEEY